MRFSFSDSTSFRGFLLCSSRLLKSSSQRVHAAVRILSASSGSKPLSLLRFSFRLIFITFFGFFLFLFRRFLFGCFRGFLGLGKFLV